MLLLQVERPNMSITALSFLIKDLGYFQGVKLSVDSSPSWSSANLALATVIILV